LEDKVHVMNGKIEIAKGDLAVSAAKLQRLQRAKDILMARGGQEMSPREEREFADSINSFILLVGQGNKEVAEKKQAVALLVAERDQIFAPSAAPFVAREPVTVPVPAPVRK